MKLKLKASGDAASSVPSTPVSETPTAQTPGASSSNKPRIKLKTSQPPTPAGEFAPASLPLAAPLGPPPTKPKKLPTKKASVDVSKKRTGDDAILPPPPKRTTLSLSTSRRNSIKQEAGEDELAGPTPTSAGPRISLKARKLQQPDRRDSGNRGIRLTNRKAAPPKRPVGVGYDSEASDAEEDPLIESQFVLRMQPGEDCDYLRDAIARKTLGAPRNEDHAEVSLKFLDKEHRRVIVTINKHNYAAAMVDLPCIVEGMKSWDKRGWWKVADICQMMLVMGPTESDDTARTYPLPKEVDKETWAYAHGLTPPMHYVRKRRFRKRASYKTVEHIDEEVERLLQLDKEAIDSTYKIVDDTIDDATEAPENDYDDDYQDGDPGDYLSTTENGYGQAYSGDQDAEMADDGDLEADILAGLMDDTDALDSAATTGANPPLPIADAASNLGDVQAGILDAAKAARAAALPTHDASSTAPTPAAGPAESETSDADEDEDDDDDDDESDEDEPTAIDEDLVERERELEGQRQDIEELERRIVQTRVEIQNQKNPLLRQRKQKTLRDLEEELGVKKRAMGLGDEDDE